MWSSDGAPLVSCKVYVFVLGFVSPYRLIILSTSGKTNYKMQNTILNSIKKVGREEDLYDDDVKYPAFYGQRRVSA